MKFIFLILMLMKKLKSIKSVNFLLDKLLSKNFNRSDLIIGVGGGVTIDLSGFVASIFKKRFKFYKYSYNIIISSRCGYWW